MDRSPHSLLLLSLLLAVGAAALAPTPPPLTAGASKGASTAIPASSPAGVICAGPDTATLCRIIKAAGSGKGATRLKGSFRDTIFAPVDSAFTKDAKKVADELEIRSFEVIFTNPKAADRLLQNLIIPGQALDSAAFKDDKKYKSLLGQDLVLDKAVFTSQYYVKSEEIKALIVKPNIPAGPAVVHKVDRVPVPDDFL